MNKRLEYYKQFIDDLVKLRPTVLKKWILEKGWPKLDENERTNNFLSKLKKEDKEILCEMVQQARNGGIHDTLVYLNEQIDLEDLKISRGNTQIAVEPYGTELFWDWVARSEGNDWPEHDLGDEYKI